MNVLKRIIYSGILAVIATALSIQFFPETEFVTYVPYIVTLGVISVLSLAGLSFYREDDLTLRDEKLLVNGFIVAVLLPSFFTAGAFMHQSQTSWSGGEIHYHADFEILVEEKGNLTRADLVDPSNFCENDLMCKINDRTGETEYHEHNDNRIHLEGVFEKKEDATLAAFFKTFHGKLSNTELVYPTDKGVLRLKENSNRSLKIIVNRGTGGNRHWCVIGDEASKQDTCSNPYNGELATSPSKYIVSPHKKGPSLDDIFIIYDSSSTREALQDLREDGKYRGKGLKKRGEGF